MDERRKERTLDGKEVRIVTIVVTELLIKFLSLYYYVSIDT